jgi:FkbM family methyltransferase
MKTLVDYKLRKYLSGKLSKLAFLLPTTDFLIRYRGGKIYLNLKESRWMMERAFSVYEFWKTKLFLNVVRQGMIIVDVGVNRGYFSLLFAKLMNDKGKVLSFEPNPTSCFWFRKSIQANRYKCIKLFQYALSDKEGSAPLYCGTYSGSSSLFPSLHTKKETITVKTRKLDNVLKDEGIDKVDILKIDVEGADLLVLKGAERLLKRQNIKLAMDVDVKSSQVRNQLFDFLKSCDFEVFSIGKELAPIRKIDKRTREIYAVKLPTINLSSESRNQNERCA